ALSADALGPEDAHVVVELSNPRVARSLRASARVVTLTIGDVVADMCAQAIRTRGMAEIFEELLGFAGDEFYVVDPASTVGRPFVECVLAVPGMVVAGIVDATGSAVLAPAFDRTVSASDRLVVIAPDTPRIQSIQEGWSSGSPLPASASPSGVRAVIIGWNDAGRGVLQRLSDFLPAGSRVEVMADSTLVDGGLPEWSWPLEGGFTHTKHDPVQILAKIQDIEASVVAVLGYSDGMTEDEADALTLLTLLTMHRARENGSLDGVRVVAHLFDSDLSGLAQDSTGLTDFVVTDALASRMLVQISRHQELGSVFADLFDATGPVVDVVPISGEAREYGVVAAQAVAAGLIPIGVVNDETVTVNPTHDLRVRAGDSLVAISRK
ncbi:MAG: hypothetical protein OEZ14_08820, partial [Acidimicrobiia bacterium]|nr:hypothetical protein [Acidimicrobiia bacterium]